MLKARLLSTVAAAMLLTVGAASAQTMKDQAPERAPAAQQNATPEKLAPPARAGERKAPQTTGQAAPKASETDKPQVKGQPADTGAKPAIKGSSDAKDSMKPASKDKAAEGTTKPGQPAADTSKATTGQGAAAGSAKLSTEQRTKITTVISQQKVERLQPSQLNISISVGTRVPDRVRFYPLPSEVFVIYPEWRGYNYIMVGNQILVVDPRTHEIVAILDA